MTGVMTRPTGDAAQPSAGEVALLVSAETGAFMLAHDWETSMSPESLCSAVSTCSNLQAVRALSWRPEVHLLDNDAYRPFLGNRHPRALGRPMSEAWPALWQEITGPAAASSKWAKAS